jgi:hypothetical protein
MERAINLFIVIAVLLFFLGIVSYSMGTNLGWNPYRVSGVYICGASLIFVLIAAALFGIGWIRKNVKIR